MSPRIQEALDILQEECAEVIVEISKCRRFGFDSLHYKSSIRQSALLEEEIGDVLALIDILIENDILSHDALTVAKENKIKKLKKWSSIFSVVNSGQDQQ